jgi:hypothetical protein
VGACAASVEPPQSAAAHARFAEALTSLCEVDRLAGVAGSADPIALGLQRTAWVAEHVDHPDVIELRVRLSVKGPEEQGRLLHDEAARAGLARCALADRLTSEREGGLSP